MRKQSEAARDRAKAATALWEEAHPKVSVRLEPDQFRQMQKLAKHSDLKPSEVVSRLIAFALEKLLQEKKRKNGQFF